MKRDLTQSVTKEILKLKKIFLKNNKKTPIKKNVNVTIRGKLYDVGFGSDFFDTRPRAQATEEENSIISKLKTTQKAQSIE